MSDNSPDSSRRQKQFDEILAKLMRAIDAGESIGTDEWLKRYPDFASELGEFLEKHERVEHLVGPLRQAAAHVLHVRCPHCHNPIELLEEAPLDEINCPSCGSSFSLVGTRTQSHFPPGAKTLGHFELLDRVGVGQFGSVWKARDTKLDRTVAIKIPRTGSLDSAHTGLFLRDARAAAQLRHPNIVSVHEVGKDDDTIYIVSDFIQGATLKASMAAKRLTPREVAETSVKIAKALHHAHESGVIHRDLKPGNIMMDADGEPHIVDFGLAKRDAGEVTMTVEGQILGTPAYMSPEQACGEGHGVDRRADIYSLGVTLFELLTGELPFRGDKQMLIVQILNDDPPSPRKLNSSVPRDLDTICLKCLRKDPRHRYATAQALTDDLQRYLDGQPILARPVGRVEKAWLWCRRRPAVSAMLVLLAAVVLAAVVISRELQQRERADGLVNQLITADISDVPQIIEQLADYRHRVQSRLEDEWKQAEANSDPERRLLISLARFELHGDHAQLEYLYERLLTATPAEFPVIRDALSSHRNEFIEQLWTLAGDPQSITTRRFRAYCALAEYDPGDEKWQNFRSAAAEHLVSVSPSFLADWKSALRPVGELLMAPLGDIFRGPTRTKLQRFLAADVLAHYANDRFEVLVDLLCDATDEQFIILFPKLRSQGRITVPLLERELKKLPQPEGDLSEEAKEHLAKRRANAAVALLKMGHGQNVWPLLRHGPDPRVRSYLIHWLSRRGGDPKTIMDRYEVETDVTIKRALLLWLGEFDASQFPESMRAALIQNLTTVYRTAHDAGLHGAAEWLLRKWGQAENIAAMDDQLRQTEEQLIAEKNDSRRWYVNGAGQTFVILEAGEFRMGSADSEAGRDMREILHRRRIGRRFAISTKEVTKAQWRKFAERMSVWSADQGLLARYMRTDDSPMVAMTWYEAALYCNWLSEQEGIPREQWCFEVTKGSDPIVRARDNFLELSGYRLPTEAEWEFACRAGTNTSRYYGQSDELSHHYVWYQANSENHVHPVGSLKPNDFGLFDMQGNAMEWCYDVYRAYPSVSNGAITDTPKIDAASETYYRVLRGGAFNYPPSRSARRYIVLPVVHMQFYGFRPARTYHLAPQPPSPQLLRDSNQTSTR